MNNDSEDPIEAQRKRDQEAIQAISRRVAKWKWKKCKHCDAEFARLPDDGFCSKCKDRMSHMKVAGHERVTYEDEVAHEQDTEVIDGYDGIL